MSASNVPTTSLTLLHRLCGDNNDQVAWREFLDRYGNKLHHWCRKRGLQHVDAEDLIQNVLLAVARQMKTFVPDPSRKFRSWLKTIAYRAWCDFLARKKRQAQGSGDSAIVRLLDSIEARDDFLDHLQQEHDRELLEIAMQRVEQRVKPETWEAFRRVSLEQEATTDVAEALGTSVGAIWVARNRIKRMLQQEIEWLSSGEITET